MDRKYRTIYLVETFCKGGAELVHRNYYTNRKLAERAAAAYAAGWNLDQISVRKLSDGERNLINEYFYESVKYM